MSSEDEADLDIFAEPQDFYQAEKPATFLNHRFGDGRALRLRLVGQSPLWGHHLWNAGKVISDYIESHAEQRFKGRTALELGAGAGLPSMTATLIGAATVVVTDYPDGDLIENLEINAAACKELAPSAELHVRGLLWGADVDDVLSLVNNAGFDCLILADLLFNHSEHQKLIDTVRASLKRSLDARALVFFTPYRPWLLDRDLAFFDLARATGLTVNKILEKVMDKVMFAEDPGDELLRRTVFGYELTWSDL